MDQQQRQVVKALLKGISSGSSAALTNEIMSS